MPVDEAGSNRDRCRETFVHELQNGRLTHRQPVVEVPTHLRLAFLVKPEAEGDEG
jgi:hypothetical protein